jgi:hypothetical protein
MVTCAVRRWGPPIWAADLAMDSPSRTEPPPDVLTIAQLRTEHL